MKNVITIATILCIFHIASASTIQEEIIDATIQEVKLYVNGAHITRTGSIEVDEGKSTLILKELSPYVDPNSLKVTGDKDFTVLSVNYQLNHLAKSDEDTVVSLLQFKLKGIERSIDYKLAEIEVIVEIIDVLNSNKSIRSESSGVELEQLKKTIEYYASQFKTLTENRLDLNRQIDSLKMAKFDISNQLKELNSTDETPTGEIFITVQAESNIKGNIEVSYVVGNCGWFPRYEIRANSIEEPIELIYKADVYQKTEVDWRDVNLVLTNVNPSQSNTAPRLDPWKLNFKRLTTIITGDGFNNLIGNVREVKGTVIDNTTGEPLIGVNIIVKGTTVGTVTDFDGRYSLSIPYDGKELSFNYIGFESQDIDINNSLINVRLNESEIMLDEVVISGLRVEGAVGGTYWYRDREDKSKNTIIETSTYKTQTSVEHKIEIPYTINSTGEVYTVEIKATNVPSTFEYYSVPKLDQDAFIVAKLTGWNEYNLLAGEANLYFENTYIGKSILDVNTFSDTLLVSLGRDKNVNVSRTVLSEFSKKRLIGGNKYDSRTVEILIRNNKDQAIDLTVFDQIPVPVTNSISVEPIDIPEQLLNPISGEIKWKKIIRPDTKESFRFGYEVKYPKHEEIILD